MSKATVKVEAAVIDGFSADLFIETDDNSFELAFSYDVANGFDIEVTDAYGNDVPADKFAQLLGFSSEWDMLDAFTEGLFDGANFYERELKVPAVTR